MIRLNDEYKTRINEKNLNRYYPDKGGEYFVIYIEFAGSHSHLLYKSKELRDKDIKLLDKIIDVKSIEDKANAYPHELDALKFAMSGIKKECAPVKKSKPEIRVNIMQEEYITWEEVMQSETRIKGKLANELVEIQSLHSDNSVVISINSNVASFVYDEDLFNALKIKKVE